MVAWEEQEGVLRCVGDEDLATQGLRRGPFARAVKHGGNVIADLSELVFADSSLAFDLAILGQRLRGADSLLVLRDPQPQIARLVELVGLDRQPGIRLAV